jgi:hypothetical protein
MKGKTLEITAVDRQTGKKDKAATKRIKRSTRVLERTYPTERMQGPTGLSTIALRTINDAIRQFVSEDDARTMRAARKLAKHPSMQETSAFGFKQSSKPLSRSGGGSVRGKSKTRIF